MIGDFFLGLTTLEAAIFAIFAAALFVLIQAATDIFAPFTWRFILRRPLAKSAVAFSFALFVLGMLITLRAAFPNADLITGDQRTAVLLNDTWPALAFVIAVAVSVALNAVVLIQLLDDFRGPGVVRALAAQASNRAIDDWLLLLHAPARADARRFDPSDGSDAHSRATSTSESENGDEDKGASKDVPGRPNRLRRLSVLQHDREEGRLTDPLGPLFELVTNGIETRRYALVDRTLSAIRVVIRNWMSADEPPNGRHVVELLSGHLKESLEVAIHSGSDSQILALIHTIELASVDGAERQDEPFSAHLPRELIGWASRLHRSSDPLLVAELINARYRVGAAGLGVDDCSVFDEAMSDLVSIAEILSQRHWAARLPLRERRLATENEQPTIALINAFTDGVSLFTDDERALRGSEVMLTDALVRSCKAFLAVDRPDGSTLAAARSLFTTLVNVTEIAVTSQNGDAFARALLEVESLAGRPEFASPNPLCGPLGFLAFRLGIKTEAKFDGLIYESAIRRAVARDSRDRLAVLCQRAGYEATRSAVRHIYLRGDYFDIPGHAQKAFKRRVEILTGWDLGRDPR